MATPELRFVDEDGNNYPDWENRKLEEIVTFPSERIEGLYISTEDMGYNIVKTDLHNRRGNRVIKKDIITSNIRPYLKKVWLSNSEYSCSSDVIILRCDKQLYPSFLYTIISQDSFFAYQMKHSKGTKMPRGDKNALKKFTLGVPSLPEQQKIANLFSLVDEKIENLGEQVSLWKQYKQGLSQQLFTQQLRFVDDEGNTYPDWEEKKLGEICKANSSKISANSIEQIDDGFPVYGASGTIVGKIENPDKIDDYVGIVKDGAGAGRVYYRHKNSSLLGTMQYIQEIENNNLGFIFHYLSSFDFSTYKSGSTIPHIYFKNYSQAKLGVPSLPEQKKIANLLSMVEDKIENLENLENEWKLYKQALMQKMFI